MKWLMRVNVAAIVVYASFTAAIVVADIWIFPKLDSLVPPPPAVELAIRQGEDIDALREISLVLCRYVIEQDKTDFAQSVDILTLPDGEFDRGWR